jgi:PAS domain S-box-containing protein
MNAKNLPSVSAIARWPWAVRGMLGGVAACLAVGLTYLIVPLHGFPLLLAFPAVVLSAWFFGMPGSIVCALAEAILVEVLLRSRFHFMFGYRQQALPLSLFLGISALLGWMIRRQAQQRTQLDAREWQRRLDLVNAERRLAEERASASQALMDRDHLLQLALKANGMGLWVWDLPEDKLHWSDEVYRMAGVEPGSVQPSLGAWLRFVHPEDVDDLNDALRKMHESGAGYQNQHRIVWPDGSVRWVEAQGKHLLNHSGQLTRVFGVITDVTHRKRAEEAMLRTEKLAIAGRLAASVAHEINNPLEAVANLLYLITLTENSEDTHAHAQLALNELMRASKITQQTLQFSRQQGESNVVKLSKIVEVVLGVYRSKLASIAINVEIKASREASVVCVPGEIQQIFSNLVANAIDAMPDGGRLVVRLQPSKDWRDYATPGMRITFCDSGTGMERATMRKLSEPFFTTKADTGTGLGMWIVTQLLDRHQGHLRTRSRQGPITSGSAFSLFLPLDGGKTINRPQTELTRMHIESTHVQINDPALQTVQPLA